MNPLEYQLVTVAASPDGQPVAKKLQLSGSLLYCKSANFPFSVRFDASVTFPFDAGFKRKNDQAFETVTFYNTAAFPLNLVIYVGDGDVDYVGTSDQKDAPTFALGNAGQAASYALVKALKVGGGDWTLYDNVLPDLTIAGTVKISGSTGGFRRKQITFQNNHIHGTEGDAIIFDKNGFPFLRLPDSGSGSNAVAYTYLCSDDFYIFGLGGIVSAGNVVINEIYYAN